MYTIITRYARFFAASGVEKSTVTTCAETLDRLFRMMEQNYGVQMGEKEITGLDGNVLMDFYADLSEGRKTATLNLYVCFLNPFLRQAYAAKWLSEDLSGVLRTHKLPSADKTPEWERKNKYIGLEEVEKLLKDTPGRNKIRDRAIIALFLGSGLRVSELCSLTIGSVVDAERGDLYVKRKGGEWKHTEVADYVYDYIDAYLQTRKDRDNHDAPLFMTSHGEPCNRNQIYKALSFKQKQLGLATGPHALRHTFVSEAEKQGSASIARDLANHRSLIVTNRYDHSTHEQRRATVNALPWATI